MPSEPEAFWFGQEQPRCFAMLHRPDAAATRGVVICNALGYEGLISCRPLAELARRLVVLGYAVLRFDYEGTGDSDGGDWEPGRTKEWGESIHGAVAALRAREGVAEVYLAGVRMGATLACRYAHDHPGIAGLALWAPCADGTAYVRELRALSRLSAAARPPQRVTADWFPQDSLEVAGFELARSTADDLRAVNLLESVHRSPAPCMLIVDHTDRSPADALVEKLIALGTDVEHVRVAGFSEFMVDDETKSVLPRAVIEQMTQWFAKAQPRSDRVSTDPPQVSPTLVVGEPAPVHFIPPGVECPPVVERAVRLPDGLFAIVTEPVDQTRRRGVAVLILNTGLTNRVGQGRLSIEQARYWASLGFTVVRVDLRGTGDSPLPGPVPGNSTYAPERVDEVIEVVDWLRSHGDVSHLVLYGICSGAYQSFHAALQGAAIDLAVLVNPAIWYNDSYRGAGLDIQVARNSTRAIFRLNEWRRLVREPRATAESIRQAANGFGHLVRVRVAPWLRKVGVDLPDPVLLSRDLNRIVRRGIDLLIVFAAAEMGEQYLRTFGGEPLVALPGRGRRTVVDIDGGDHVFSAPGARQRLIEAVTRHLEESFPFDPVPAGPTTGKGAPSTGVKSLDGSSPLRFDDVELGTGQL